jgi:hypothetical protein
VEVLTPFYSKRQIINGALWNFFTYKEELYYDERYEFVLDSETPMDVYFTAGPIELNEPNEFNFDVSFKQQKYLKLTSDMFSSAPQFSVAVLINNLEYYTNTTGQSLLKTSFMIYNTKTGQSVSRFGHSEIGREVEKSIPHSVGEIKVGHVLIVFCLIMLGMGLKKKTASSTQKVENQSVIHSYEQAPIVYGAPLVQKDHNSMY